MTELDDFAAALDALGTSGADDLSFQLLDAAAEVWVKVAKDRAPVDTGQLVARHGIQSQSDTEVVIVADTPYASYQEYGTRHVPARGFFRAGQQAAADELGVFAGRYPSVIAAMLDSGGHPNPRSLL